MTTLPDFSQYKYVIVAFSGGKDSIACFLSLLEAGCPPEKIEFWHHIVDGREGSSLMDWPCTDAYCRRFAAHFNIPLYFTWKVGGFEGEMCRSEELTKPIKFEVPQPDGSVTVQQTGGVRGKLHTRRKFPQISGDLSVRWCSAFEISAL